MKTYFLTNMYISTIQHGIQSGHAKDEMWLKYSPTRELNHHLKLLEFARDHKTWIILNGGDHFTLGSFIEFLDTDENPYPWVYFKEPGLNNAITSVGIVLPERFYNDESKWILRMASVMDLKKDPETNRPFFSTGVPSSGIHEVSPCYTYWDVELLKRLGSCPVAR